MTNHDQSPQEGQPAGTPPPQDELDAVANEQAQAGPDDALAKLQAELAETQNRLLRVSADYQNFARRAQNNIEAARQEQLMDVAKALLGVLDHFDLALEAKHENATPEAILKGVRIVRDELLMTLERFAIRGQAIKPGDEFVPGQHEAIMQQDVPDMDPGRVAAVLQKGYELGDITLRPAKVSVSK